MARPKKAAAAPAANDPTREDVQRFIKEFNRQQASASEYAGHAGQVTKTFVERHNVPRPVARDVLRKSKMEVGKMQAEMREQIKLWFLAGFFDHTDMFDDILDHMEGIVDAVRSRKDQGHVQDEVVSQLVQ